MDKFKCRYEIDDGYCGESRPQYFSITENDLEDDMDEEYLKCFFDEAMHEHFMNYIDCVEVNKTEFIEWAKDKISKM